MPVRQRVLSLAIPLRLLLAAQPKLLTPVLQVAYRAVAHVSGRPAPRAAGIGCAEVWCPIAAENLQTINQG